MDYAVLNPEKTALHDNVIFLEGGRDQMLVSCAIQFSRFPQ